MAVDFTSASAKRLNSGVLSSSEASYEVEMKILFALVAISLSTSMSALASPLSQTLFGHRLEIRKAPDGFDHLFVDRKPLLDDQSIDLMGREASSGVSARNG